ncbi:MAG TPA: glycosyltransferase family 2 protein [Steroidobacteraceae bacterium]|jgi:glycosyltransferase involved in cell wall biosynthesis|nr:glycosyltransferase family 2 protein [Steroidobacteraceae bacterium]
MRTSIALATYQGGRFLRQQLESFLNQTRPPDELCVSDDGSTDDTLEIIRAYSSISTFPVKLVVNPQRGGVNKNFENAAVNCTGDAILFSDQDDVWLPSHIESLVAPMERDSRIMAVASDSQFVDETLKSSGGTQAQSDRFPDSLRAATMRLPRNQLGLVLRQNIHSGHGMAFRRSLLPLMAPFTETFMFDEWVLTLAATAGFITYAAEPLTLHRQHQRQTLGARNKDLQLWATQSKNVSKEQERVQEEKWREMLNRVRERRDLLPEFRSAEKALQEKLDFVVRRTQTRQRPLPVRVLLTIRELILGRYHRLGRGWLAFARDLYGVRQR